MCYCHLYVLVDTVILNHRKAKSVEKWVFSHWQPILVASLGGAPKYTVGGVGGAGGGGGRKEGGPMRGLGTDHLISGPMRVREKNIICWRTLTHRQKDRLSQISENLISET